MRLSEILDYKLNKLDMSQKELEELKMQLLDNAEEMKKDFLEEGFSEEEAQKKALDSIELDELITSIKESSIKKYLTLNRILAIIFAVIYSGFLVKCISNNAGMVSDLLESSYIPFRFLINLVKHLMNYKGPIYEELYILDQSFILMLFIPFGILIPIVINKCNSLKANLKIFIVFVLFFSLIFYPRHFNFDLTVLRILACILGFYILRFFINKSKAKQY
ncbi:hypothetical protein QTH51_01910 [Clostridium perfringens]|uniref:hypothetical protein n=1 Tax=Clostridium perfringens TaxID=1502 RepID=UPI002858ED0D|nr:hypothetical protein [Clostridium perfringens]MDM0459100.1 hypothetical protein [Clostridium perfringens]